VLSLWQIPMERDLHGGLELFRTLPMQKQAYNRPASVPQVNTRVDRGFAPKLSTFNRRKMAGINARVDYRLTQACFAPNCATWLI